MTLLLIGRDDLSTDWAAVPRGASHAIRVMLGPLPAEHIGWLLRARGIPTPSTEFISSLSGLPLLAQLVSPGERGHDRSLSQVLASRLAQLQTSDRDVLEVAALALERVDMALLQEVLAVDAGRLRRGLARLRVAGLLRAVPSQDAFGVGFEPAHGSIRAAALDGLSREKCRSLHGGIAPVLDERGAAATTLVFHWTGDGQLDRRRRYLRAAAEEAERTAAFASAGAFWAAWARETTPADADAWLERAADLLRIGGRYREAAEAYEEALASKSRWPLSLGDEMDRRLRVRGLGGTLRSATRVSK